MKRPLHVLYVPGLGDDNIVSQRVLIGLWKIWGVHARIIPMRWSSDESWDRKKARVSAFADRYSAKHGTIGIVGVSAGASAALTIFAQRRSYVHGCVLIAAKGLHADGVGPEYRRKNPALYDAVRSSEQALDELQTADRARIQSRFALWDGVVPRADSIIPGARNRVVFSVGHALTIATQLLFGAPFFVRFLRIQLSKKN